MSLDWNYRHKIIPCQSTSHYSVSGSIDDDKDAIKEFRQCLRSGYDSICNGSVESLHKEATILNLALNNNIRFRKEVSYQKLKKVVSKVRKWEELDIVTDTRNVIDLIPCYYISNCTKLRVPTKKVLQYLLSKLLGSFNLLLHIDDLCLDAAAYSMAKIRTGHFFMFFAAFVACVARIRALALDLANISADTYNTLVSFINTIGPVDDQYPQDLIKVLKDHSKKAAFCKHRSKFLEHDFSNKTLMDTSSYDDQNISLPTDDDQNVSLLTDNDQDVSLSTNTLKLSPKENKKRKSNSETNNNEQELDSIKNESNIVDEGSYPKKKQKKCDKATTTDAFTDDSKPKIISTDEDLGEVLSASDIMNLKRNLKQKKNKSNKNNKINDQTDLKSEEINLHLDVDSINISKMSKDFKKINKINKTLNDISTIKNFLTEEKKLQQCNDKNRLSKNIPKKDWKEFTTFIDKKLKFAQQETDEDIKEEKIKKIKLKIKFWMLVPKLKGRKPENWQEVLQLIKNI